LDNKVYIFIMYIDSYMSNLLHIAFIYTSYILLFTQKDLWFIGLGNLAMK